MGGVCEVLGGVFEVLGGYSDVLGDVSGLMRDGLPGGVSGIEASPGEENSEDVLADEVSGAKITVKLVLGAVLLADTSIDKSS